VALAPLSQPDERGRAVAAAAQQRAAAARAAGVRRATLRGAGACAWWTRGSQLRPTAAGEGARRVLQAAIDERACVASCARRVVQRVWGARDAP
jgi:hypothetical protein